MDTFSIKGSSKWDDSSEGKQLHSNLFDGSVSLKKLQKGKKPSPSDQNQSPQASKNKSKKWKGSQGSDNFTGIKKAKKTGLQPGHLVLPMPVEDVTTEDQQQIKEHAELYPQSRENSPPRGLKKNKRKRKDSVTSIGSDASLGQSKSPPEKSDERLSKVTFDKKNRTRRNSQGDEHDVAKMTDKKRKKRKRRSSVSSIGSDTSLGNTKSPPEKSDEKSIKVKKFDKKNRTRRNSQGDKGDVTKTNDKKVKKKFVQKDGKSSSTIPNQKNTSPTSKLHQKPAQSADGDGENDGEPKEKKKRKRKPRKNKFKDLEGNVKQEFKKQPHSADGQRSSSNGAMPMAPQKSHVAAIVRTNGTIPVKKELSNKQKRKLKRKLSSTKDSSNVENKRMDHSPVKHGKGTMDRNVQKDLPNAKMNGNHKSPAMNSNNATSEKSHSKKNLRENKTSAEHSDTATENRNDQEKSNVKQKRKALKRPSSARNESSPAKKNLHEDPISAEHSDKAGETANQEKGNVKEKRIRGTHRRPAKGRKGAQAKNAKPNKTPTSVKPEKGRESDESEDEGEKVMESVVQSEGLLQRVTKVKKDTEKQHSGNKPSPDDGETGTAKSTARQRKRKNKSQKQNKLLPTVAEPKTDSSDEDPDDSSDEPQHPKSDSKEPKGQSQRSRLENQLMASHFRFLNEKFYQCSGSDAYEMMTEDRKAFEVYHEGYSHQVQQWPVNPVDIFIKNFKNRPSNLVVGDFGCGEAQIAQSIKQKVHSFDLCALNKHVTVCDIAQVPLDDGSLDVAVFCLSLMGTNWIDYVKEANRVLKTGGVLKIAEVASRFQSLAGFVKIMKSLGFQSTVKDLTNKMFYLFDFTKQKPHRNIEVDKGEILKPCLYKKR